MLQNRTGRVREMVQTIQALNKPKVQKLESNNDNNDFYSATSQVPNLQQVQQVQQVQRPPNLQQVQQVQQVQRPPNLQPVQPPPKLQQVKQQVRNLNSNYFYNEVINEINEGPVKDFLIKNKDNNINNTLKLLLYFFYCKSYEIFYSQESNSLREKKRKNNELLNDDAKYKIYKDEYVSSQLLYNYYNIESLDKNNSGTVSCNFKDEITKRKKIFITSLQYKKDINQIYEKFVNFNNILDKLKNNNVKKIFDKKLAENYIKVGNNKKYLQDFENIKELNNLLNQVNQNNTKTRRLNVLKKEANRPNNVKTSNPRDLCEGKQINDETKKAVIKRLNKEKCGVLGELNKKQGFFTGCKDKNDSKEEVLFLYPNCLSTTQRKKCCISKKDINKISDPVIKASINTENGQLFKDDHEITFKIKA